MGREAQLGVASEDLEIANQDFKPKVEKPKFENGKPEIGRCLEG